MYPWIKCWKKNTHINIYTANIKDPHNYLTQRCHIYKLDLEKAEEAGIKLPTFIGHRESKEITEKHLPVSLTTLKPLTV